MIHYAESIIQVGNLIDFATIRFEAKHSFFKTVAHTIHNNINLILSVARKHQIKSCLNCLTNDFLNNEIEILDAHETNYNTILGDELKLIIKEKFQETSEQLNNFNQNVIFSFYGQIIKKDMCLIINKNDNTQEIVKVANIFEIGSKIYLYCNELECLKYDEHYCAYQVCQSSRILLATTCQIYHYKPFSILYNLEKNNENLYVKPFCLFNFN